MKKIDWKDEGRMMKGVFVDLGKYELQKIKECWGTLIIIILENNHK